MWYEGSNLVIGKATLISAIVWVSQGGALSSIADFDFNQCGHVGPVDHRKQSSTICAGMDVQFFLLWKSQGT